MLKHKFVVAIFLFNSYLFSQNINQDEITLDIKNSFSKKYSTYLINPDTLKNYYIKEQYASYWIDNNGLKDIAKEIKRDLNSYVLLNRVNANYSDRTLSGIKDSFRYEPYKFFDTVIRDRVDYKFSLATGKSVIESGNDLKAIQEITSLYEEIKDLI